MKNADTIASKERLTPRARLDEGALGELLGYQLAQASIVTTTHFQHAAGQPFGLGTVEFTVVYLVKQNPGVTASRLARALAITMPAVTVWMNKLEQRGLVSRQRSTSDRRSQHFAVTPQGDALVSQAIEALLATDRQTLNHLSQAEMAMLLELLRKVAHHRTA